LAIEKAEMEEAKKEKAKAGQNENKMEEEMAKQ